MYEPKTSYFYEICQIKVTSISFHDLYPLHCYCLVFIVFVSILSDIPINHSALYNVKADVKYF